MLFGTRKITVIPGDGIGPEVIDAALKVIAVGVGTASALPILEETTLGQHSHTGMVMQKPADEAVQVHRFFNAQEIVTIATIAGLIIPADEQSPGTDAAGVPRC